jgi:anthranilate synthase/aminodeoxychorismate synthase-like glutamine amidotransferase
MIVVVDNYDSFVYNLAQYLGELGAQPLVLRNDAVSVDDIAELGPTHIVVSPGPRTPLEAGISNEVIRRFAGRTPILGVCLGHQCIGHVYGGRVVHAAVPTHGKRASVYHDGRSIYQGMASPLTAGRYHSLVVSNDGLPPCLQVTARTEDGTIMGLRHTRFTVEGVQFHPESIMTPSGLDIMRNFLACNGGFWEEEQRR